MKKLLKQLMEANSLTLNKATKILKFFTSNFNEEEELIAKILESVVKDYPCTLVQFYDFCKELQKTKHKSVDLKTLYSLYCALSWYGICHESRVKSVKRSLEILKTF